jgi:hypothetical protein
VRIPSWALKKPTPRELPSEARRELELRLKLISIDIEALRALQQLHREPRP